ncbi:helix-turn-helix domain-containing protein, partial [Enterococcus faecium]|uniref:helix-turn-helix domain-containing protein n=1 Tax=Enterococcus faecium TaxID=1352 RepID=UPI001FCC55B8
MQTFLTKTSFKKVVLLDYLLEKDNWCAMEELRNLLNVTEKSVLHYIEELEDLFKQYNGNIQSSPDSCVKCYTMFLPFLLIKIDVFS